MDTESAIGELKRKRAKLHHNANNTIVNAAPETKQVDSLPDLKPAPRFGQLITGKTVSLVLWHEGHPLHTEFEHSTVVGRAHPQTHHIPDVDLLPVGGALKGVSRKHVRFVRKGSLLYVEDLDSTNGTLLNGTPLLPHQLRVLRDGDVLHLGRFELRVELLTKKQHSGIKA